MPRVTKNQKLQIERLFQRLPFMPAPERDIAAANMGIPAADFIKTFTSFYHRGGDEITHRVRMVARYASQFQGAQQVHIMHHYNTLMGTRAKSPYAAEDIARIVNDICPVVLNPANANPPPPPPPPAAPIPGLQQLPQQQNHQAAPNHAPSFQEILAGSEMPVFMPSIETGDDEMLSGSELPRLLLSIETDD